MLAFVLGIPRSRSWEKDSRACGLIEEVNLENPSRRIRSNIVKGAANIMHVIRPVITVSNGNLILLVNSKGLQPQDILLGEKGALEFLYQPTTFVVDHCPQGSLIHWISHLSSEQRRFWPPEKALRPLKFKCVIVVMPEEKWVGAWWGLLQIMMHQGCFEWQQVNSSPFIIMPIPWFSPRVEVSSKGKWSSQMHFRNIQS